MTSQDTFKELKIPSFVWGFVRKVMKNPIQAGILAFIIYQFLKNKETKVKKESISKRLNILLEDITIPIKVGDTILGGKFKNRKIVVKDIGKNDKGEVTINGKPLMKFRLIPKEDKKDA